MKEMLNELLGLFARFTKVEMLQNIANTIIFDSKTCEEKEAML